MYMVKNFLSDMANCPSGGERPSKIMNFKKIIAEHISSSAIRKYQDIISWKNWISTFFSKEDYLEYQYHTELKINLIMSNNNNYNTN